MSGKITAKGFRVEEGTGLKVLLDDGTTKPLNEFGNSTPIFKTYVALISQTGTSAPTVKILENTIGNVVWSRESIGVYKATLLNAFTLNKTIVFGFLNPYYDNSLFGGQRQDSNVVFISTTDTSANFIDSALIDANIEIRVYN